MIKFLQDTHIRVHITDGRVISGQFYCFDQMKNIIILDAYETREGPENPIRGAEPRSIGPLVMIPGKHLLKLKAQKKEVKKFLDNYGKAKESGVGLGKLGSLAKSAMKQKA